MEQPNTNPQQAITDKISTSKNILVTVSNNPTVDQLAACLGLTIWLNKAGKHATAVFSGEVPNTLEFLQPAETLEKNTDSLRDFIIALDKSKADKLRYKVEENIVKIFITPYRTSLTADDLEFSQGDFNVDMVLALGVSAQADLDTAITSHGRILHDATVATVTIGDQQSELGAINWHDSQASSLSELMVELGNAFGADHLDGQIATALLTGVVAETDRFSNEKTTPQTMRLSAQLMSAGANQQLVASELAAAVVPANIAAPEPATDHVAEVPATNADGTLNISHDYDPTAEATAPDTTDVSNTEPTDFSLPEPAPMEPAFIPGTPIEAEPEGEAAPEPQSSEPAPLLSHDSPAIEPVTDNQPIDEPIINDHPDGQTTEPPQMGGTLTANTNSEDTTPEPNPIDLGPQSGAAAEPLLNHDAPVDESPVLDQPAPAPAPAPIAEPELQPAPPSWTPPEPTNETETLTQIEQAVDSPHLVDEGLPPEPIASSPPTPDLDSARDEVARAIGSMPDPTPEPVQALNAQSIDLSDHQEPVLEPAAPTGPDPSMAFDPAAFGITDDATVTAPAPEPVVPAAPEPTPDEFATPTDQSFTMPLPATLAPPPANPVPPTSIPDDPTAPPPVPPPLPFTPGPLPPAQ